MTRMKYLILLLILPIFLTGLEYVPNQLIFKTSTPRQISNGKIGLDDFDSFLTENDVLRIKPVLRKSTNNYYVATLDSEIDWEILKSLSFDGIEYFQPNYLNSFFITPNDPEYSNQSAEYEICNIPQAWDYTTGHSEIIVSVIDSGLYFDHPDMQNNVFINHNEIPDDGIDNDNNGYVDDWRGWDFVDAPELYSIGVGDYLVQDNDPTDELNHGTHVSGIIAADANNNEGVCGICWSVKILAIRSGFKTVDGLGYLQDDDAASGIIYSADMGADIINLSWGDINYSPIIAEACDYAYQMGSIVVASAGNEGGTYEHLITYPARLASTISVGSVDNNLNLSSFSSYGPQLDLVAPGHRILSTYNLDPEHMYKEQSGTSMSGPFVAASIGLLLSVEPDLNFEEVRSRLLTSTDDLGASGFDNIYGYGLLDTYAFLTNLSYPIVEITSPLDNSGHSESFEVIGTATAPDFWRYSVKYTSEAMPSSEDWQVVDPSNQYYYDPVEDDVLVDFEISNFFTSGTYQLKVEVTTLTNQQYHSRIIVHIDQSPPVFKAEYAAVMKRYAAEVPEYYLQAVFDEKVLVELNFPPSTNYILATNIADSIQVCKIPNSYTGVNPINLRAVNICGLESYVDDAYFFQPDYESIDIHSFEQTILDFPLSAIRKTYDFDNDGNSEIIALNAENHDEPPLLSIEVNSNNEMEIAHTFDFSIWPHDLGNTDQTGIEILGIRSMTSDLVIYETTSGNYPDEIIYQTDNAYGGSFIDYSGDGIDDIAIIKNITDVNGFSHRIIELSQRFGDVFSVTDSIYNTSFTSRINTFVNKVACGYLDNDNYPDILTADTDGDIMIFEREAGILVPKWGKRLPVANAYFLLVEDFTGDGNDDFCVGGYTFDPVNINKSFSFFEFFSNNGNDDEYISTGYISFNQLEQHNSIANADFDGDDDQEIILSLPPNFYIIDYVGNEYVPIWKGESDQTALNVIAACHKTDNEDSFIVTNIDNFGEFRSSLIKVGEEFNGPPTPQYFTATPIDSTTAKLGWTHNEFDYFNISKRIGDDIVIIGTSDSLSFIDQDIATGDTIFYRITAINSAYDPDESKPTIWKSVTPLPAPNVEYVKMISQYDIKIKLDKAIGSSAFNITNFFVEPDIGYPLSVNMMEENTSLIIKFTEKFEEVGGYTIHFSNIIGLTGVPLSSSSFDFDYQEDTEHPEIIGVHTSNIRTIILKFSEALNQAQAEDLANYTLVLPAIDLSNEVEDIQYFNTDSTYVSIHLQEDLKYTNQSYFLRIDNIEDVAGNKISNSGNKCHFSLTGILGIKSLKFLKVYPNPLDLSKSDFDKINFINLPLDTKGEIWIYNLNGELIFNDDFGPYHNPVDLFSWNCKNNFGNRVSSGIYFYIIKMGKDTKKGKFAIIN